MPTTDPAPHLDRQGVVDAARRLVEREGAVALTMQLLADELGVSAMAAYRHVSNKSELLLLVANDLLSSVKVPPGDVGPWTERLRLLETAAFTELSRAPDLWSIIPPDAAFEEQDRLSDAVIEILLGAGFDPETASLAYEAIFSYVIGQVRLELQLDAARRDTPSEFSGPTEQSVLFGKLSTRTQDGAVEFQKYFEYGLKLILTGLEMDLQGRLTEPG
jgi:AcrR family transcriptional regulator